MLFNVSVGIASRNISVVPTKNTDDFNPKRNLTRTVMTQFLLISAIEINLYTSQVGNALNSSITGWTMSNPDSTPELATLAGLEQAFVAMTDNMLGAFGSAQLEGGNFSQTATALVHVNALRFGSAPYIYAIFPINALIVIISAAEALRTRGWRKLIPFNYVDSRTLVASSSLCGTGIADAVLHSNSTEKPTDAGIGSMLVRLRNRNDEDMVAIEYAGLAGEESGSDSRAKTSPPLGR